LIFTPFRLIATRAAIIAPSTRYLPHCWTGRSMTSA
jgi:hypothetical protein